MNGSNKRLEGLLEEFSTSSSSGEKESIDFSKKEIFRLHRTELNFLLSFLKIMLANCHTEALDVGDERNTELEELIKLVPEDDNKEIKNISLKETAKNISDELLSDWDEIKDESSVSSHPEIVIADFFKNFIQDQINIDFLNYTGLKTIVSTLKDVHYNLLVADNINSSSLSKSAKNLLIELFSDSEYKNLLDFSFCTNDKGMAISEKCITLYRELYENAVYILNEMKNIFIDNLSESIPPLSFKQNQHGITFRIVNNLLQLSDKKDKSCDSENDIRIESSLKENKIIFSIPQEFLKFDDRVVDVFDICLSLWIEYKLKYIEKPIFNIDIFLQLRGIKPKKGKSSYRTKDRKDIVKLLFALQSTQIIIENYQPSVIVNKNGTHCS